MAKIADQEFLFGADPEVFVRKAGRLVSAHDLVPGSKREPFAVELGMIQPDGLAAEFGIKPAKTLPGFRSRIRKVREILQKRLDEHGCEIFIKPSVEFDKNYYQSLPEYAKELGCDPDYNAYTGQTNPAPNAGDSGLRSAGGHVHIGWTQGADPTSQHHFEACRMLTKQLDVYLGVPSLIFDGDSRRRELYGKAGAFRPKSYGMEYRTLSNAWLRHKDLVTFVYEQTVAAITDLMKDKLPAYYEAGDVQSIINEGQTRRAQFFCRRMNFEIPKPPADLKRVKE